MSKYNGHTIPYQKVRYVGKLREAKPSPHNLPKIKFVKRSGWYVMSYFEPDERNGCIFKQKWAHTRKELENNEKETQ